MQKLLGRSDEAAKANNQATAIFEKLVAQFPDRFEYAYEWAATLLQGAILLQQSGNWLDAEKLYGQVLDFVPKIEVGAPRSRSARVVLASAHNNLGTLRANQGKLAEAEQSYRLALELRRELVTASPADRLQRFETGKVLYNLADVLDDLKRPEEGEKYWLEAKATHEKLVKEAPGVADFKAYLAKAMTSLASYWKKKAGVAKPSSPTKMLAIGKEEDDELISLISQAIGATLATPATTWALYASIPSD